MAALLLMKVIRVGHINTTHGNGAFSKVFYYGIWDLLG